VILPCLNTTTLTETQCSVAPSGSGAIAAAAMAAAEAAGEALLPVVVEAAPEREPIACMFALEGEGDRFVSGVEGVWIIGKGDADAEAEFGFRFRVEYGLNKFGFGALMASGCEVEAPAAADDCCCCSFLDTCERVEVGFRWVTKRWTI
jgi:hypothetical protein